MKKFELKHVCSYPMGKNGVGVRLPKHQIRYGQYHVYKLNGVSIGPKGELGIELLMPDDDIITSYVFDINKCKLILRPMSDLTKEIEVNGEKFVPMEWFMKEYRPLIIKGKKIDRPICVTGSLPKDNLVANYKDWIAPYFSFRAKIFEENEYQVIEQLFEWHFDVFGLIDKGLAIDINSLS